ncbi:MAG: hypothetical protein ABJA71_11165 [Ginsengibacter sp.]
MFLKKPVLFVFFFISSLNITAQTVDEVISNYITFTGGEQQWKIIHTIVTTGTYNYGGIEFPFSAYSKSSNLYKFVVPFNGKYYAQAFDGKQGWKIDAFKNETKKTFLTGKAALAMANEADVELESPFINYQKKGYQAFLEGKDTVNTIQCFKVKFIRSNGEIETYFFDSTNFELVKKRAVSKNAEMKNAMLNTFYSDYNEVNGVKIPYKSISKTDDGQTILIITVKKMEINIPVPDTEFQ